MMNPMVESFEDLARRYVTFITEEISTTCSIEWLCRMRGQLEAITNMGNQVVATQNSHLMVNMYDLMERIDYKLEEIRGD
jgi:hypothetical protein